MRVVLNTHQKEDRRHGVVWMVQGEQGQAHADAHRKVELTPLHALIKPWHGAIVERDAYKRGGRGRVCIL